MAEKKDKDKEKKEEKKEAPESKEKLKGDGVWKIAGLLIIFGIFVLIFYGISHYRRLSRNLDYDIQQNVENVEEMMDKEEEKKATEEGELMMEEDSAPEGESETNDQEEQLIKAAVLTGAGVEGDEVDFTIGENTQKHAKGNIKDKGSEAGGGYWLAAKTPEGWVHVYDGQANPTCEQIDPYNFPTDMVEECLDDEGNVVGR